MITYITVLCLPVTNKGRLEEELIMKFVTVKLDGTTCPAMLINDDSEIVLFNQLGYDFKDLNDVINMDKEELLKIQEAVNGKKVAPKKASDFSFDAPIIHPVCDTICLGLNYKKHAEEASAYQKDTYVKSEAAIYFAKHANRITAWDDDIPMYEGLVKNLDYEVELGVIISKEGKNIAKEDAKDYIFGYTVINDVSARDVQNEHKQWYLGKSVDGFLPMGPCVLTADELSFPPRLEIKSFVNGELRQKSSTDMMIHPIDEVISELSRYITLMPGTIIATGTPEGVGMGMNPPQFLKKGDVVTCEIEKIGKLMNRVL